MMLVMEQTVEEHDVGYGTNWKNMMLVMEQTGRT